MGDYYLFIFIFFNVFIFPTVGPTLIVGFPSVGGTKTNPMSLYCTDMFQVNEQIECV